MRYLILIASHLSALALGFAAGIYALPILTAPPSPAQSEINAAMGDVLYTAKFVRSLKDSDALHWGEGTVRIGRHAITFTGRLAPGPDYKLYLSPEFVETEDDFKRLKPSMVRVGDVNTFENFIVPAPEMIDPDAFTSVIVWCESFEQFITAARYR